jgi:chemotaxis protein MotB
MIAVRLVSPVAAILALGCVSSTKYEGALRDAERARSEELRIGWEAKRERESLESRVDECTRDREGVTSALETSERQLTEARVANHNVQTRLDEATAIDDRLRDELRRLGKNVTDLLTDRGAMSRALDDAKARLEELRKAQAAADARASLSRQLLSKLKGLAEAGQLRVTVRQGRLVLELPSDVLFDAGHAVLKADGQRTLEQLASALKTLVGKKFQVAGHTDDVRIDSGRYISNWELSTARALSVVHLLIARGVPPEMLSAAGYGEFSPVATNDTPETRAKNRRIEISLVPDLDTLASLPNAP